MDFRGYRGVRGSLRVVGRWKVTEVRTFRTEWDWVPLSAAFFAALALTSWGLAAATLLVRDLSNSKQLVLGGSSGCLHMISPIPRPNNPFLHPLRYVIFQAPTASQCLIVSVSCLPSIYPSSHHYPKSCTDISRQLPILPKPAARNDPNSHLPAFPPLAADIVQILLMSVTAMYVCLVAMTYLVDG